MVELMCNWTFEDKDPNEAMEYMDLLAENAQNWDTTGTYEACCNPFLDPHKNKKIKRKKEKKPK